jgi:hypothetical protein
VLGDGMTDDSDALQAAFDAGAGKTVIVPPGEYVFTKTLHVDGDNTTIIGYGDATHFVVGNSYSFDSVVWRDGFSYPAIVTEDTTGVAFRDFYLTGNKTEFINQRQFGVAFVDSENGLAENLHVDYLNYNPTLAATYDTMALMVAILRSKDVHVKGGLFEYAGYEAVGMEEAENCTVDGISGYVGWRTLVQTHRGCKQCKIINSHLDQVDKTKAAITMHGGESVASKPIIGVQIRGNTIYGLIAGIDDGEHDIIIDSNYIDAEGIAITSPATETDVIVTGNTIKTTVQAGELLATRLMLDNNIIINTNADAVNGITLALGGSSEGKVVSNNIIDATNTRGINFYTGATGGATIKGNKIKCADMGVYSSQRNLTKFVVDNNEIESGTGTGIYFTGGESGAALSGIKITDNDVKTSGTAISISGYVDDALVRGNKPKGANIGVNLGANITNAWVTLNDLKSCTTGIADAGTTNVSESNRLPAQ